MSFILEERSNMATVRIITDVTAHLSPEFVAEHNISVLPVQVRYGDRDLTIGPDDSPMQLFRSMVDAPAKESRATIPTGSLQEAYDRLSRQTSEILVIVNSSKLSGGFTNARSVARPYLGRCRIVVMDSLTASWGLGLMVKTAAVAAKAGQPLDEIVRQVRGVSPHIYLVFFAERLDYLERGGRIGQAQAILGTMLRIKPLLLMEDGDIIPLEKVRTRGMAIGKLADFVAEFASIQQVVILASPLDGRTNELVDELKEQLGLALPDHDFPVVAYDPVLACHLGPEALGVVVYEGL